MFDKSRILPHSPFLLQEKQPMTIALPAFKCSLGSLSASIFLAQAPASAGMPLSVKMLTKVPLFPLPRSFQGTISPFSHRCGLDALPVLQGALCHFPPGPSSFHAPGGQGLLHICIHIHLPEPW